MDVAIGGRSAEWHEVLGMLWVLGAGENGPGGSFLRGSEEWRGRLWFLTQGSGNEWWRVMKE